ncbi:hypothetical protein PybrP1_010638 [[Pythium] brassicae (nom. inval.)]|nr:hypothetical protein PybrP1_010638 [[Pythium] brassicae (nom. inval.)]
MHEYWYTMQLESFSSRLVYLAEYELGDDGAFDIALDVVLTIDTPKADAGRTMLHLVVCDGAALRRVKSSTLSGTEASPSYCAIANRTLDDYCLSYPLEDMSREDAIYRVQKTVSMAMRDSGYNGVGTLYFLLDACETAGGDFGVLRSCLDRPDSKAPGSADRCFYCPLNFPLAATPPSEFALCVVPKPILPHIFVSAAMNLCNKHGDCLGKITELLPTLYAALSGVWGLAALVWIAHIRAFPDAAVDLQNRMKLVPLAQCAYAGMTCLTLYTERHLVGTARNFVVNVAILAQLFALAVSAEVVTLIAKGWKITRPSLRARERQWMRFVTLLWATSFTVLKNAIVKHMMIFLLWGIAWALLVFMIWYSSAFNMNMLKYQVAMVRQMEIDHRRTPVYTKYLLFRRFRGLLGLYMFLSCVLAVIGLLNDSSTQWWQLSSVVADEALNFALYIALGYTFRCRRFHNLLHASSATPGPTAPDVPRPSNTASIAPAPADLPEPVKRQATLVFVVSPDQAQSLGTTYHAPSPGDASGSDKDAAAGGNDSPTNGAKKACTSSG